MIVGVLVLYAVALVVLGTTALAATGALRLNTVVGIRIHAFMGSQEAWRAGHRAALPPVAAGSLLAAAAATVSLLRPDSLGVLVFGFILLVALLAWGVVRGDQAALVALHDRSEHLDPLLSRD